MGDTYISSEHSLGLQAEAKIVQELTRLLAETQAKVHSRTQRSSAVFGPDYVYEVHRGKERHTLFLEVKSSGIPTSIFELIGKSQMTFSHAAKPIWVLGAPYVSPAGAELCRKGGLSYVDLCGNHDIRFGGVHLSSRTANVPRGERAASRSLFSPRSSRVSLALLLSPDRQWTQRQLSHEVGVSVGLVNRLLKELARRGFVQGSRGQWSLANREELLSSWAAEHKKRKRESHGFFSLASMADLETRLDRGASEGRYRYALTEESGAKYRAPFGQVTRLVFYGDQPDPVAKELELKRVDSGANVVVVTPPDEGVFYRMTRVPIGAPAESAKEARNVTNDIYLYLDLLSFQARGEDFAEHLLDVVSRAPRKRSLATSENAAFVDFLKARDQAYEAGRTKDWKSVVAILDKALPQVRGIDEENVRSNVQASTFTLWMALLELTVQEWKWDEVRGESPPPEKLVERVRREIPSDDEVLKRHPPLQHEPAQVRYLLGLRHAILTASYSDSSRRQHHAQVARDHFKIAISPYTQGSRWVAQDVERVMDWLKKIGEYGIKL